MISEPLFLLCNDITGANNYNKLLNTKANKQLLSLRTHVPMKSMKAKCSHATTVNPLRFMAFTKINQLCFSFVLLQ